MFVAALGLVYVNLLFCYQLSRFIFLGSFVSREVPRFPSALPLEPPGVCYGDCTLHILVRVHSMRPLERGFWALCAHLLMA